MPADECSAPAAVDNLINTYVARLRQAVQPDRTGPSAVRSVPGGGYRLDVHSGQLDLLQFRELNDEALAVTELRPKSGFYDYDAKYTEGMTEHVCPAHIPDDIRDTALSMALKAHRLLGCRGASRSDFRWDDERGEEGLYLLEVNTQPGMTPLSLVPEQARARGIDYATLVERIVEAAL